MPSMNSLEDAVSSIEVLDDLSLATVLSFLSFEDKIRTERVCKRWQKLLYLDQKVLVINREMKNQNSLNLLRKRYRCRERIGLIAIELKPFKSVLQKCPKLEKISLNICFNGKALQLIGELCPRLKSLKLELTGMREKPFIDFARNYGHKLQTFRITAIGFESDESWLKQFLDFCPNVKKIRKSVTLGCMNEDDTFLPLLEDIQLSVDDRDLAQFNAFTTKYSQIMKRMKLTFSHFSAFNMQTLSSQISRLHHLKYLALLFFNMDDSNTVAMVVKLAQQLTKLEKFEFLDKNTTAVSDQFFWSFSDFKSLKILNIEFGSLLSLTVSLDSFRNCSELRVLRLSFPSAELNTPLLTTTAPILPRLVTILIDVKTEIPENAFEILATLKSIGRVITWNNDQLKDYLFGKDLELAQETYPNVRVTSNCFGMIEDDHDVHHLFLIRSAPTTINFITLQPLVAN